MMHRICDNQKCGHHIRISESLLRYRYIEGGVEYEGSRYLYRSRAGKDIFLCESCHAAVELIARSET